MISEGIVQKPSNISFSDGDDVKLIAGKSGERLVSPLHGALYYETYYGHLHHGYNTTPTALPITTTTDPVFLLWNPYGSGVNVVLVHCLIGYDDGTNVDGSLFLGVLTNAGSSVQTGGVISSCTAGPTINGKIGAGSNASTVKFCVSATLTNPATQFLTLGLSLMVLAKTGSASITLKEDFNGTVILTPGTAVFLCDSVASVATYYQRLSWYEYPE